MYMYVVIDVILDILGSGVRMMAEYCSWSYMVVRSTLWYSKILLKITVKIMTGVNHLLYLSKYSIKIEILSIIIIILGNDY